MGIMTLEMNALARMDAAREEGYAAGEEAGKAEGLVEGEARGKAEGFVEGERRGEAKGKSEERDRFQALITMLTSEGRLADLESVADDPDALNALMVENGL